jgi:hypothetical protein
MWRFPLVGLFTVGGLFLLLDGFLGDPAINLRALRPAVPVTEAQAVEPDGGAIPAQQTEPTQGAAATPTVVVVPVNRPPVSSSLPWEPDSTPVSPFDSPGGPSTSLAAALQRVPASAR